MKPSELRRELEKQARNDSTGGALVNLFGGGLKSIGSAVKGLGTAGVALSVALPLLMGAGIGYGAYSLSKPRPETAADMRHTETLALYKRLGREARDRTSQALAKRQRQSAPAAGRREIGNILSMSRSA